VHEIPGARVKTFCTLAPDVYRFLACTVGRNGVGGIATCRVETFSCILYIATNCNIVVFMTVYIYIYLFIYLYTLRLCIT